MLSETYSSYLRTIQGDDIYYQTQQTSPDIIIIILHAFVNLKGPWAVQENRPPREDLREDASRTEDRADRVPQGSGVRSELLKIELKVFYNIDTEWDVVVLSFKESNFENQIAAGIMCWDINTLFKELRFWKSNRKLS